MYLEENWHVYWTNILRYKFYGLQTEETKASDKNGAIGILGSVILSLITGYAYIMGLSFVLVDPDFLLDPSNDAGGYAIGQLFYQVFKDRYGSGTGGLLCMGVVAVAIYLCCMNALTGFSRYVNPSLLLI